MCGCGTGVWYIYCSSLVFSLLLGIHLLPKSQKKMNWQGNDTRAFTMSMPQQSHHPQQGPLPSAPTLHVYTQPANYPIPQHQLPQGYARGGVMAIPPPPVFTQNLKGKKDVK